MLAKPQRKLSKNGVFLEQGFVCYESILTGESRGILGGASGKGASLIGNVPSVPGFPRIRPPPSMPVFWNQRLGYDSFQVFGE